MKATDYYTLGADDEFTMSATRIKRLKDPWDDAYGPPIEPTPAMTRGSLVDCLLLTPEEFPKQFITLPEDAPRRPSKAHIKTMKKGSKTEEALIFWKAWEAKASSRTLVTKELIDQATERVEDIKGHPVVAELLDCSVRQSIAVCEYKHRTGQKYQAKAMADLLPDLDSAWGDTIPDLKITDPRDGSLGRQIINMDWHVQSAWYLDTFNQFEFNAGLSDGAVRKRRLLICCDWDTGMVRLRWIPYAVIEAGRKTYQARIDGLEAYRAAGSPKYEREIQAAEIPAWFMKEAEAAAKALV